MDGLSKDLMSKLKVAAKAFGTNSNPSGYSSNHTFPQNSFQEPPQQHDHYYSSSHHGTSAPNSAPIRYASGAGLHTPYNYQSASVHNFQLSSGNTATAVGNNGHLINSSSSMQEQNTYQGFPHAPNTVGWHPSTQGYPQGIQSTRYPPTTEPESSPPLPSLVSHGFSQLQAQVAPMQPSSVQEQNTYQGVPHAPNTVGWHPSTQGYPLAGCGRPNLIPYGGIQNARYPPPTEPESPPPSLVSHGSYKLQAEFAPMQPYSVQRPPSKESLPLPATQLVGHSQLSAPVMTTQPTPPQHQPHRLPFVPNAKPVQSMPSQPPQGIPSSQPSAPHISFAPSSMQPLMEQMKPPSRPQPPLPNSYSQSSLFSAHKESFGVLDFGHTQKLLDSETVAQSLTRSHSARIGLGSVAVIEARKGLSRIIITGDSQDLDLFGRQLINKDKAACEMNYEKLKDKVLCIAVSYKQHDRKMGRFKFSDDQWRNLKVALAYFSFCGVAKVRIWLDQCLWIRDARQESWAHTGIMPYVLWPVLSLGTKAYECDRTAETYSRMWPFVEELAALWSMGLFVAEEMRDRDPESKARKWLSYNLRERCEPEDSVLIILLNIFHGAADHLATGWAEDVKELKDMAERNITTETKEVVVGSDWRIRLSQSSSLSSSDIIERLGMPPDTVSSNKLSVFLDGSRRISYENEGEWDGVREWMSGYEDPRCGDSDEDSLDFFTNVYSTYDLSTKLNILTDQGEFQLLGKNVRVSVFEENYALRLWLLVAMDGRSSRFGRGKVAWTKVVHGKHSPSLYGAVENGDKKLVEQVLLEQIEKRVHIIRMKRFDDCKIQWA